jgi:hypothetical protein
VTTLAIALAIASVCFVLAGWDVSRRHIAASRFNQQTLDDVKAMQARIVALETKLGNVSDKMAAASLGSQRARPASPFNRS